MSYEFTHSVECRVGRESAWAFWSDVGNWARVDPAVESVRLEGPFAAGTRGETKPRGRESVGWRLAEVDEGRGALVEVCVPGAVLKFAWTFEEPEAGLTRMTQRVTIEGERADFYAEGMGEFERGIPLGMRKLADAIVEARGECEAS